MPGACYELQEHHFRGTGRCCGSSKRAAGQEGLGQTPPAAPRQDRAREPLRALPSHWKPASGNCQGKRNQLPTQTSPSPLPAFLKLKKKLGTSLAPTSPKSSLWDITALSTFALYGKCFGCKSWKEQCVNSIFSLR